MAGSMAPTRRRKSKAAQAPSVSAADRYKELLGYQPSNRPSFTTANVKCGGCGQIKPGCDYRQPITFPSRCRDCCA